MGRWIQKTSMPTPRHDLQAIAAGGKIYAISGADDLTLDVVEIYDVATDTWAQGPPIPTRRGWLGADLLEDRIYVAGGKTIRTPAEKESSGDDTHFEVQNVLEVLDLGSRTWSALAPLPQGRAGVGVAACQGKLYMLGGSIMKNGHAADALDVYDPQRAQWSTGPAYPFPVMGPGLIAVEDRLYAIAGSSNAFGNGFSFRPEVHVLDPQVGKWERLAAKPRGRESMGITVLDGKIFAFGGRADGAYHDTVDIYDIKTDSWSSDTPMPVGKAWLDACTVDGRIFALGGAYGRGAPQGGYVWIDDLHEFVP